MEEGCSGSFLDLLGFLSNALRADEDEEEPRCQK
jgi:hypothetical protein